MESEDESDGGFSGDDGPTGPVNDKKKKKRKNKKKKKKSAESSAPVVETPTVKTPSVPPPVPVSAPVSVPVLTPAPAPVIDEAATLHALEAWMVASAERERIVAEDLRVKYADAVAISEPSADPLTARQLALALSTHSPDTATRGPPPPLETLAVENNILLGILIARSPHEIKHAMFGPACEVLTYLASERGEVATQAYVTTPRFDPLPASFALNPRRMRTVSVHSWWLLLLLESMRVPPKQFNHRDLFSNQSSRDDYCVVHADVASPRDQLRKMNWFGYDWRRCESRFSRGTGREWIIKEGIRSVDAEKERRDMVAQVAVTAEKCVQGRRYLEAVHVLEEAISISGTLVRRPRSVGESSSEDAVTHCRLVQQQFECLQILSRSTEGYRFLSKFEGIEARVVAHLLTEGPASSGNHPAAALTKASNSSHHRRHSNNNSIL